MRVRVVLLALWLSWPGLTSMTAWAQTCAQDRDAQYFLEQRDHEERMLLTAWINNQLSHESTLALAAQIGAWETRFANACDDHRFVQEHVHLLHPSMRAVTTEAIPARLFFQVMGRLRLRALQGSGFETAAFEVFPRKKE